MIILYECGERFSKRFNVFRFFSIFFSIFFRYFSIFSIGLYIGQRSGRPLPLRCRNIWAWASRTARLAASHAARRATISTALCCVSKLSGTVFSFGKDRWSGLVFSYCYFFSSLQVAWEGSFKLGNYVPGCSWWQPSLFLRQPSSRFTLKAFPLKAKVIRALQCYQWIHADCSFQEEMRLSAASSVRLSWWAIGFIA